MYKAIHLHSRINKLTSINKVKLNNQFNINKSNNKNKHQYKWINILIINSKEFKNKKYKKINITLIILWT
jgi:hypothetical protein